MIHSSANQASGEAGPSDRRTSLIDDIKRFRDEVTTLVRQEVALARAETSEKVRAILANGAVAASGGVMLALAGVMLGVAAGFGLYVGLLELEVEPMIAMWLSPLIIAAVLLLIGGVTLRIGMGRLRRALSPPHETIASLKEDQRWLKEKLR